MANVAFIGTGLLGSGMVEGMLRRGDAVTVWNRTQAKAQALEPLGARVAASPEQAVEGAERVHLALPDDAVVDDVVGRIRPRLAEGAIVVDHSTTAPLATGPRVVRLTAEGVRFLHAPVFMSPQMARTSAGLMLAAGPGAVYEAVQPALAGMTAEVWYVGEDGTRAAAYKIFGNAMLVVITAGVTDVFAMAHGAGMSGGEALELFKRFQPGGAILGRGSKMAAGDWKASFELTMARKDVRLMIETAGDAPLLLLPAIARRMDEVIAAGHGQDDLGAIAR